jgi:hypothetical protein
MLTIAKKSIDDSQPFLLLAFAAVAALISRFASAERTP